MKAASDARATEQLAVFTRADFGPLLGVAIWPFLFLGVYTFRILSVGNDFYYDGYCYKAYLISSLASGHFPLWDPINTCGFPLFSNPYAAPVYPLNVLLVSSYVLFGGLTGWDYTLFTILGLSIYATGLYCLLRMHCISTPVAFGSVLIASMSLKPVELLRYPTAVHAAAWMPWLLLGIALACERKHVWKGTVLFGASTLMILTAGYPYFVIYTPFLAAPFLAAMLIPRTRSVLLGHEPAQPPAPRRILLCITGAFSCAVVIASPWLLQVRQLLDQTSDRQKASFGFVTNGASSPIQTLGSWIFPPAASMEGWYYFGMAATILIGSYVLILAVDVRHRSRERYRMIMILGWVALVSYLSWGRRSMLFTLLWRYIPVFDRMREWNRISIILVPALTLLLALSLSHYVSVLRQGPAGMKNLAYGVFGPIVIVAALVLSAQVFLLASGPRLQSPYWQDHFKLGAQLNSSYWKDSVTLRQQIEASRFGFLWHWKEHFDERFFPAMTLVAGACLVALPGLRIRHPRVSDVTLVTAIVVVSAVDLVPISTMQWVIPFRQQARKPLAAVENLRQEFAAPRTLSPWEVLFPFDRIHKAGLIESWDLSRHRRFFLRFFDPEGNARASVPSAESAAARRLFGADGRAKRIFITSSVDYDSPVDFMADVDRLQTDARPNIHLISYDGDSLTLTADLSTPSWVSFIDNWAPGWAGKVDGKEAALRLLFGSYKALPVSAGSHTIEFRYRPTWFPVSVDSLD
jgi:hypothetical protein